MIRLGLCCQFQDQPIKFSTTTATALARMRTDARLRKLSRLCLNNADALMQALEYCAQQGIGCFRILSQILPAKTHPAVGYELTDLPEGAEIIRRFQACGQFARANRVRTCFHPDQFVVLNSPRPDVVARSIKDLEYHAELADWVGADVINIHGGGAYGDKSKAIDSLRAAIEQLPPQIRRILTLENDDKTFTPRDLLPVCRETEVPLVYDVHHHRCLPDEMTIHEATDAAIATWKREPMFHLSSPLEGWTGTLPHRHHDYIDIEDFPDCWLGRTLTVEVEAKAKEFAVQKLRQELDPVVGNRFRRARHRNPDRRPV